MTTYRKLTEEEQKKFEKQLGVKKAMMRIDEESVSIISENCWFCNKPWVYELDIALRDGETKELIPGRFESVHICERCRKEHEPVWVSYRVKEIYKR